jgi:SAM-dependent methyltransferase
MSQEIIRSDFDRIASLSDKRTDHNPYENYLLAQLPQKCDKVLEVGCGTGAFTRLLARRADEVLALDLSPVMIRRAVERSPEHANIDFQIADITTTELPAHHFDAIVSLATLHHLPQRETVKRLKNALRTGGTLLIHDLFAPEGLFDLAASGVALWVNAGRQLIKFARLRPRKEVRDAWKEHGRHDTYLTIKEVRALRDELLPAALVKRHLLWRYSLIWRKPEC